MKLERINENQIRCTLNISDLDSRHIKLSEFAYGSGKTRELFRDMMRQASAELGFEVDDIPLMIEAVPISSESITLIITKVDNPEEFEKFDKKITQLLGDDDLEDSEDSLELPEPDYDDIEDAENSSDDTGNGARSRCGFKYSAYSFDSLSRLIKLAKMLPDNFDLENALYKSPENGRYYLIFSGSQEESSDFNKLTDIVSEFGERVPASYATEPFYSEHFEHIIVCDAIQRLKEI